MLGAEESDSLLVFDASLTFKINKKINKDDASYFNIFHKDCQTFNILSYFLVFENTGRKLSSIWRWLALGLGLGMGNRQWFRNYL